jgi:hypothetical protein
MYKKEVLSVPKEALLKRTKPIGLRKHTRKSERLNKTTGTKTKVWGFLGRACPLCAG